MKYAIAINDQGIYAPTRVGDFVFLPEYKLHAFHGKIATTPHEICEQVNAAVKALGSFGDPFITLRVAEIEGSSESDPTMKSLLQANEELRAVIYGRETPRKVA